MARSDDTSLHLSIPPEYSCLPSARERVRSFLRGLSVDEESVEDLLVCVQEALKNSIRFSGGGAPVELDLRVSDHTIRADVRDHGEGFGPGFPDDLAPLREQPDPLAISGRGLFLIANLTDEVKLLSDDGAHVCMVKRLPSR